MKYGIGTSRFTIKDTDDTTTLKTIDITVMDRNNVSLSKGDKTFVTESALTGEIEVEYIGNRYIEIITVGAKGCQGLSFTQYLALYGTSSAPDVAKLVEVKKYQDAGKYIYYKPHSDVAKEFKVMVEILQENDPKLTVEFIQMQIQSKQLMTSLGGIH